MTREQLLAAICPSSRIHECEKYYCLDCNRELIKCLDEYENYVIEQYKEKTKLKDTIRDIHDNVSHEMYCKAIDDCLNILKIPKHNWGVIEWAIRDIEKLKEQKCNNKK